MRFSARHLPAVLLLILSLPTSLLAQTAPKQTTKAARNTISGRVTLEEKGVAGVTIALRKTDFVTPSDPLRREVTDPDGFYRITNVAPGAYEVSATVPAFVRANTKEARGKPVLVGEDDNVENIDFALVRGGVITGRVTDADGRPLSQQQVYIYRADAFVQAAQQRELYAAGGAQTDNRGIYRAFGLAAGRYKVAAGRSDEVFTPYLSPVRSNYRQVFHPDATDQDKATVIEVGEGIEATNVDITLGRPLQTYSVAGRLVDGEKGLPVPNIRLDLQRQLAWRAENMTTPVYTNSQGEFVAEGLIPGKYGVLLLRPNIGVLAESPTFDVIDQDLSGITIKLIPGASLSGVVLLETENKAAFMKLSEFYLSAYVTNPAGPMSGGLSASVVSQIGPDGTFQLKGLPAGMVHVKLSSGRFLPKGFNFVRLERDGVAMPRGIEIKEGEQLTGVRVVIAYGSATVRGVVKLENGTLPSGARILVSLVRPGGDIMGTMRPPSVDERGFFQIEGVAAGTYELSATISGMPLNTFRPVKRDIIIEEGETTNITLTIDMSARPNP
jgi:carboxypeptidase family protein